MIRNTRSRLALALLLIAGGACFSEHTTPTKISAPEVAAATSTSGGVTLVECPGSVARSTSALIGPLGGVLSVGNTRVLIPANAVLFPTSFTLTVPASKYVEIDVTAGGADHYLFDLPVIVTIDYGRCGPSDLGGSPLSVWNIDPQTKALLERMGGVDDKLTRTVTFTTLHFSGYAVAD